MDSKRIENAFVEVVEALGDVEYKEELKVERVKNVQEILGQGISAIVDNKKVFVGNEKLLSSYRHWSFWW